MENDLVQATAGNTSAQYRLGVIYCLQNNPKEAHFWLRSAAHRGHDLAREFLRELLSKNLLQ